MQASCKASGQQPHKKGTIPCSDSTASFRPRKAALEAHAASEPFVKNVAIINDCGEMKIEKFDMR